MKNHRILRLLRLGVLLAVMAAAAARCSPAISSQVSHQVERLFPSIVEPTRTPFQPVPPTPTHTVTPTSTPLPVTELRIWVEPSLPTELRGGLHFPNDTLLAETPERANLVIGALHGGNDMRVDWVYALVAPFPTLADDVSVEEIQRAWRGEAGDVFNGRLLMEASTHAALEARWGPPAGDRVEVLAANELVDTAWDRRTDWAVIPFEQIVPRWKVLRVNGLSPLEKNLDMEEYPLSIWFGVSGSPEALRLLEMRLSQNSQPTATSDPGAAVAPASASQGLFPASSRDPGKITTLVMTGVTALTRATGYKMDTLGTTYPGRDIGDWLRSADLTHISNEVSFNPDCPKANYADTSTIFCSRPEYIELLEFIGADVIELSGNHNNDFGRVADRYSLEQYRQRGWAYFAGGANEAEAHEPARFEINGNRLAFIGCNPAGPPGAWATADQPGAAACGDYEWLYATIRQLREEGYLPIVTFQYAEMYAFNPSAAQKRDFRAAADAGAVIVSGSQAHFPQVMEFYNGAFIHYGLGNLFFDQMDDPVTGTRREFIDRYTFYEGRYIQTELLTALLEDYSRPRPMDSAERESFLTDIFGAAGW